MQKNVKLQFHGEEAYYALLDVYFSNHWVRGKIRQSNMYVIQLENEIKGMLTNIAK